METLYELIDHMKKNQVDFVEFDGMKVSISKHYSPVSVTNSHIPVEKTTDELLADLDESLMFHSSVI